MSVRCNARMSLLLVVAWWLWVKAYQIQKYSILDYCGSAVHEQASYVLNVESDFPSNHTCTVGGVARAGKRLMVKVLKMSNENCTDYIYFYEILNNGTKSSTSPTCSQPFDLILTSGDKGHVVFHSELGGSYSTLSILITEFSTGDCSEFTCANDRCLSTELLCTDYDNCGDNSNNTDDECSESKIWLLIVAGIVVVFLIICCLLAARQWSKNKNSCYKKRPSEAPKNEVAKAIDRNKRRRSAGDLPRNFVAVRPQSKPGAPLNIAVGADIKSRDTGVRQTKDPSHRQDLISCIQSKSQRGYVSYVAEDMPRSNTLVSVSPKPTPGTSWGMNASIEYRDAGVTQTTTNQPTTNRQDHQNSREGYLPNVAPPAYGDIFRYPTSDGLAAPPPLRDLYEETNTPAVYTLPNKDLFPAPMERGVNHLPPIFR